MSKKFIVETGNDVSSDGIYGRLVHEHTCKYTQVQIKSITELQPLPEVKKIETGVLMSPAEIVGCDYVDTITWVHKGESMQLCKDSSDIGKRLNIYTSFYPHVFYRDIQKTWDFASIPVGALIEVAQDGRVLYGIYQRCDDFAIYFSVFRVLKNEIKSIRIIETKEATNEGACQG